MHAWMVSSTSRRNNVLYFLFDDLRGDLGAGSAQSKHYAPHLHKLATEGVSFDLAFSQVAFCVPSRASFLTGMRPEYTRSVHNDQVERFGSSRLQPLKPGATVFDAFKRATYVTAAVGKIFHFAEQHPSIDLPVLLQTLDLLGRPCDQRADATDVRVPHAHARFGFPKACTLPFGAFVDERIAAGAVGYLRKLARLQRPFLLMVGFMRPHNPYQFPSRFLDRVPAVNDTDVPRVRGRHPSQPAIAYADSTECTQRKCLREQRRYYRAAVAHADEMLGVVLHELFRLGLAGTTLVVAHADHGFSLGENGAFQKRSNFDHATRVPLLLRDPRLPSTAGLRIAHAPVELVDVLPTLLDLSGAGRSSLSQLQGRSLRPLLLGDAMQAKQFKHAFMVQPRLLYLSRNASSRRAARASSNPLLGLIIDGGANVTEVILNAKRGSATAATSFTPKDCSAELVAGGFGPGRACRFVAMGFSVRARRWRYTRWERWPIGGNTSRIWTVGEGKLLAEELYCYRCNVSSSLESPSDATPPDAEQINLAAPSSARRLTAAQRAMAQYKKTELLQALVAHGSDG